jgi:hypothetical protein
MSEIEIITKPVVTQNLIEKKKQIKHSNFFITINLNKRFATANDALNSQLYKTLQNNINECWKNIKDYIIIKDTDPNATVTPKYIKKINGEGSVEVGEKFIQLHAHLLIKVDHYTMIHFNYQKLKSEILRDTNLKNIYVYCKLYKDVNKRLQDYIYKQYD